MTDLDRAMKFLDCHAEAAGPLVQLLETARREGAEAERAEWMSCARVDALMEGPALKGWNRSALDRLWKRAITPEER